MSPSSMGSGDDGYTGLLGKGRIPKYHPRPDAYGTVDEASAALGLARSLTANPDRARLVKVIQRDLYTIMIDLATTEATAESFEPFSGERVKWLEGRIREMEETVPMPSAFVIGGDSAAGAAFDLARTIVRRAERLVARLSHEKEVRNPQLLRYLNRLSSLCFLLSLAEYQEAGFEPPSLVSDLE